MIVGNCVSRTKAGLGQGNLLAPAFLSLTLIRRTGFLRIEVTVDMGCGLLSTQFWLHSDMKVAMEYAKEPHFSDSNSAG